MWIRGSVRLLVAALLGVEISIIALASAASAAPVSSSRSVEQAPPPIVRTYQLEEVIKTARWYASTLDAAKLVLDRTRPRQSVRVSHAYAVNKLVRAGLRWKSSGRCIDRRVTVCTSLEAVRSATLNEVIALKKSSGCRVMVTGGTEAGHAPGVYSHHHGYKLDITHNACIDRFITGNYPRKGTRRDGAALYRSSDGTVFADEVDHWDIMFR